MLQNSSVNPTCCTKIVEEMKGDEKKGGNNKNGENSNVIRVVERTNNPPPDNGLGSASKIVEEEEEVHHPPCDASMPSFTNIRSPSPTPHSSSYQLLTTHVPWLLVEDITCRDFTLFSKMSLRTIFSIAGCKIQQCAQIADRLWTMMAFESVITSTGATIHTAGAKTTMTEEQEMKKNDPLSSLLPESQKEQRGLPIPTADLPHSVVVEVDNAPLFTTSLSLLQQQVHAQYFSPYNRSLASDIDIVLFDAKRPIREQWARRHMPSVLRRCRQSSSTTTTTTTSSKNVSKGKCKPGEEVGVEIINTTMSCREKEEDADDEGKIDGSNPKEKMGEENGESATSPQSNQRQKHMTMERVITYLMQQQAPWGDNLSSSLSTSSSMLVLCCPRPKFHSIVSQLLKSELKSEFTASEPIRRYNISKALVERKQPLVIFCGGTSGCGKSTLAGLIAARLGIHTVISTDTIREVLRRSHQSSSSSVEYPEIFSSTYNAFEKVPVDHPAYQELLAGGTNTSTSGGSSPSAATIGDIIYQQDVSLRRKILLLAYKRQCQPILTALDEMISGTIRRNEPLIVEGVHLLSHYMIRKARELALSEVPCISFIVDIENEDKHKERLSVRGKSMTLLPKDNKYVYYFQAIRHIQQHLLSTAAQYDMSCINNTNVDRSVTALHHFILQGLENWAMTGTGCYNGAVGTGVNNTATSSSPTMNPSSPSNSFPSSSRKKKLLGSKEALRRILQKKEEKRSRTKYRGGLAAISAGEGSATELFLLENRHHPQENNSGTSMSNRKNLEWIYSNNNSGPSAQGGIGCASSSSSKFQTTAASPSDSNSRGVTWNPQSVVSTNGDRIRSFSVPTPQPKSCSPIQATTQHSPSQKVEEESTAATVHLKNSFCQSSSSMPAAVHQDTSNKNPPTEGNSATTSMVCSSLTTTVTELKENSQSKVGATNPTHSTSSTLASSSSSPLQVRSVSSPLPRTTKIIPAGKEEKVGDDNGARATTLMMMMNKNGKNSSFFERKKTFPYGHPQHPFELPTSTHSSTESLTQLLEELEDTKKNSSSKNNNIKNSTSTTSAAMARKKKLKLMKMKTSTTSATNSSRGSSGNARKQYGEEDVVGSSSLSKDERKQHEDSESASIIGS